MRLCAYSLKKPVFTAPASSLETLNYDCLGGCECAIIVLKLCPGTLIVFRLAGHFTAGKLALPRMCAVSLSRMTCPGISVNDRQSGLAVCLLHVGRL